MFRRIYVTYVRPKLKYVVLFCNLNLKKHEDKIERVQRHATKMVPELRKLNYEDSLKERKERGDMITTFKFLKEFEKVKSENYFDFKHGTTKGYIVKLKKMPELVMISPFGVSTAKISLWG